MLDWLKAVTGPVIGAILTVLVGAVKHLWSRQKAQAAQQEAVKDCLTALTYDRITIFYGECERKGFADIHDREKMEVLYKPYHALGGNGTGTDCYNKLRALPTEPPEGATA